MINKLNNKKMGMKKQHLLGMMAMMAAMNSTDAYGVPEPELKEVKPKKIIIPKGLKEFFYGENMVYALNRKNADKKARKKGYL